MPAKTTFVTIILIGFCSASGLLSAAPQTTDAEVNFSRDIRPLLSNTCFKCHGPDANTREAGLRLDSQASAIEESDAIIAGDSDASELFQRLISDDPDTLMPPPESGRSLTPEQIELIRKWIDQGASWGNHWSLVPPQRTVPPPVDLSWKRNQIDAFVMHRLKENGMQPSVEADRRTLARRVALDLTGLPPSADQLAAFLDDPSPTAYERYVDQLIASPQYGEHMARHWLDVVRYGDTHGLHLDNYREHWPYRDWIINAFNQNKPYDQFSIEQLAGDLLEEPTRDQLIATGFNRSHVTTAEGGSIKEEVKVRNVVDRTSTFGTVFLGMTLGCAQCHDHKFDPISQREFYSLFAYFNSLDGDPMDGNVKDHQPSMLVGSEEELNTVKTLDAQADELKQSITTLVEQWKYNEPDDPPAVDPQPVQELWIDDTLPKSGISEGAWTPTAAGGPVQMGAVSFVHKATGNQQYFLQNVEQPWEINDQDELFAYVFLDPQDPPREIMLQWNDGTWEHRAIWGENLIEWGTKNSPARLFMGPLPELGKWVRIAVPAAEVNLATGAQVNGVALTQYDGTVHWDAVGKLSHVPPFPANRSLRDWIDESIADQGKRLPAPLQKIITQDREKWTEAELAQLRKHFIRNIYADAQTVIEPIERQSQSLVKQRDELKSKLPSTLIFRETEQPKEAFVLERGAYDQPKEKVERAVPATFPPIPEGQKNDRLALARWLFTDQHPLTARVTVNRFWQQVFGVGLVETSEDFGAQGTFPTHPDLLDYLALDFQKHGWDVKRLLKQMVMSAAYRQNSAATSEAIAEDPANQLLARGKRYRLDAEVIRDQALAVSGLLVESVG
ncbi:MAG: PSD1 and planctomycete cytochrome C domain-containing protein, partial [Pirellulaceae bacterium]|nr:PSD1 and planctomycete cytochrome C domain-containing protein [Pirellulaceae bacterium]